MLLLSGLSFLGLGIQPPNADWGALVRENITGIYEAAPAVLVPAVAIAVLTISVTLLIDGFSGRARTGHVSQEGALDGPGRSLRPACDRHGEVASRATSCAIIGFSIERGEVLALIGQIGLRQDHDCADLAGLCPARLPHRRRQRAHRRLRR